MGQMKPRIRVTRKSSQIRGKTAQSGHTGTFIIELPMWIRSKAPSIKTYPVWAKIKAQISFPKGDKSPNLVTVKVGYLKKLSSLRVKTVQLLGNLGQKLGDFLFK